MRLWPFGTSKAAPAPAPRRRFMPRRPDPLVSVLEKRAYDAAELTRMNSDWSVSHSSSNEELRRSLPVLRAAARHHERNSDLFRRWLSLQESNVVHDGFELRSTPRFPSGQLDRGAAKAIEEAWWRWASKPVTLDGRLAFPDVEKLALRTLARDGEVFVKFHIRDGQLRLEVLEGDHVPVELHRSHSGAVLGVQLDADRRPVAYWVTPSHPGDALNGQGYVSRSAELVPADRMVHVFRSERPGQARGVPWGSAVFDKLLMLQGYQIAELAAARMDASRPVAIERAVGAIGAQFRGDGTREDPEVDLSPGGWTVLGEGETMSWSPGNHPSGTFAPFVSEIKRDIAAGLQVSYHALNSDLSGANYSSLKHGRADEVRAYSDTQDLLASQFHTRAFHLWLELFLLSDANPFPMSKFEKFASHEWHKPAFEAVDDEKEASAIGAMLELGLTTKSEEAAKRGKDYADLVAQTAADRKAERDAGVADDAADTDAPEEDAAPDAGADATDAPDESAGQDAINTSALALNGTQVTSLLAVLDEISTGKLPKEVGKIVLVTAFAMPPASAAAMVDPLELRKPEPPPAPFGHKPAAVPAEADPSDTQDDPAA